MKLSGLKTQPKILLGISCPLLLLLVLGGISVYNINSVVEETVGFLNAILFHHMEQEWIQHVEETPGELVGDEREIAIKRKDKEKTREELSAKELEDQGFPAAVAGAFIVAADLNGCVVMSRAPGGQVRALVEHGQASWIDLVGPAVGPRVLVHTVLVGRQTASAGEVLAALITSLGGARLCGRGPTAGEATLKAVIPVDHDWRLLVERAEIVVPPYDLRQGLRPSHAC